MVSMQDYMDFGQGMGIASAADVAELNKALNTGAYAQANGVAGQTNGAALQVQNHPDHCRKKSAGCIPRPCCKQVSSQSSSKT